MGKTRRNKLRSNQSNPVGIPSVNEISLEEELSSSKTAGPVPAIMEQLQSVNSEDKMCGFQTLSTLCQNEQDIDEILASDIVRTAAPFLVDSDMNIRHAAAGAFRNLSAVNVEICENLVELDVLTPLLVLLNRYANDADWIPKFDKLIMNKIDSYSDTFLQAVNLVWNLCESTSIALETFNQSQLLNSFVKCLNWNVYGLDIAIAVAQCLLVISEDNPAAWKILCNYSEEFVSLLTLDGDYPKIVLRTVGAGIMANVPALCEPHLNLIFLALSKTLDINHRDILCNLTSSMPIGNRNRVPDMEIIDDKNEIEVEESEDEAVKRRLKADMPTDQEIEIKHVGWLLQAQRISAEVLSNICSTEDDWEEQMDDDDLSDVESVHDYDTSLQEKGLQNCNKLPVEITEPIKTLGIIEKLWQRTQPLPENVSLILQESDKNLTKRLKTLRISLFLCLQNFCNLMSKEDLGGAEAVYNVWLDIGQQVFQGSQDANILEASTSLMRATLEHLKNSAELFQQMSENDLQLILTGAQNCCDPEIRANWMRMLGILGSLLPEPLVKKITQFLVATCISEEDVWSLSEGLDSLMDVFSDNDWPQIIYELNLMQSTRELDKIFKNKIRSQKRELKDRYPVVLTVKTNFSTFCNYLKGQMKNYVPRV